MGLLSNKISREELKPGDHIYSWRHAYIYAHHGIYTGEEKAIHFTRGSHLNNNNKPCPSCGYEEWRSGVVSTCLDCFLRGGKLYRFEYGVSTAYFIAKGRGGTCSLAPSDPPEESLRRATVLLNGRDFGAYDLFENNCEDFAVYCKTGLILGFTGIGTGQSSTTLLAASTAALSSPLQLFSAGLAAAGFGALFCVSRLVTDIGVRRDSVRLPVEMVVARLKLNADQICFDTEREIEERMMLLGCSEKQKEKDHLCMCR